MRDGGRKDNKCVCVQIGEHLKQNHWTLRPSGQKEGQIPHPALDLEPTPSSVQTRGSLTITIMTFIIILDIY